MPPDSPADKQTDLIEVLHDMTQSHSWFMSSGFHFILSSYYKFDVSQCEPYGFKHKDPLCHRAVKIFLKYVMDRNL